MIKHSKILYYFCCNPTNSKLISKHLATWVPISCQGGKGTGWEGASRAEDGPGNSMSVCVLLGVVFVCDRERQRGEGGREGGSELSGVRRESWGGRWYWEPGFIREGTPWLYKNGWNSYFCCFDCILMKSRSKSGSSGETGEGILIKINHAGFGNKNH